LVVSHVEKEQGTNRKGKRLSKAEIEKKNVLCGSEGGVIYGTSG